MAKGYPSRSRARKAYMRGVKAAKTGRGLNPYRNERLKVLFDRGRDNTPRSATPEPLPPRSGGDLNRSPRSGGSSSSRPRSGGSSFGGGGRDSGGYGRRRI
jgi:uncharacterized membrane protein YgcG